MKKISSEQYRDLDRRMCDLQYKLTCLEQEKNRMSFEEYMRERSLIIHKMECHRARLEGVWNRTPETYRQNSHE